MNVGVIGTGYVGLVAGACLAESGNDVICGDISSAKVEMLSRGEIPIYEPGLEAMIEENVAAGRLSFTTDLDRVVRVSDVIFIAVGTPEDADGSADLSQVLNVAGTIGRAIDRPKVVVNKSTVPVGTADLVRQEIARHTSIRVDVVSNPEFLKEGSAVEDFMKPDRVVIGAASEDAAAIMRDLYSPFVRTNNPILVMDNRSAEVTKYTANAMLATRISFMNEIANFCELVGADVSHVRSAVGADSRIGASFLFPGVGFGGSCFPKDIRALAKTAADHGQKLQVVDAVDRVNAEQKRRLVQKVADHYGGMEALKGKRLAIWGLSFKPKTDDMREAPSLTVIRELRDAGATICAYDPEATENARRLLQVDGIQIDFAKNSYEALDGADALLILTEWNEFRRPNLERIASALSQPIIFDGRNLFEPASMGRAGFTYYSIGRAPVRGVAPGEKLAVKSSQ